MSSTLSLELSLFQDGILRVIINEREANPERVRLSAIDDGAMIAEEQLDSSIDVSKITEMKKKQAIIKTKSANGKD